MPNIKGPNGKVISFPDGTSDADISSAFSSMGGEPDTSTPAGLPAGQSLPGVAAHPAVNMQPSILGRDATPGTAAQRLLGDKPISNTLSVIGQHAKNMVAGPYHALTDAPRNPAEEGIQRIYGQPQLAAYRMLAQPTIQNGAAAIDAAKSGDYSTAGQRAMDAIPIVGPWARGVENDAQTYGAIPSLFGLGTDVAAPMAAGKLFGGAMNLAGKAAQAAATTPEALKIASTRALVTGSPGEMLNRALKPPVTMPDFERSVEASLPTIAAQIPVGVKGFARAAEAGKNAEQSWYKGTIDPIGHFPIDASPIADAQMDSIPLIDKIENPATLQGGSAGKFKVVTVPGGEGTKMTMGGVVGAQPAELRGGIVKNTAEVADNYRRPMPLRVVDAVRVGSNQKLASFFAKAGGDKYAAMANPETARMAAVNDASRNLTYDGISRLNAAGRTDVPTVPELSAGPNAITPEGIAANQNLFGHLSDVADVAGRRATVAGRANPLSLQESLALHGNPLTQAYNFGTARLFKGLTDSDAVTNAALDRFNNPGSVYLPPRPTPFAQSLSSAGTAVSKAGKLNPFFAPSIAAKGDKKKIFGQ